MTFGTKDITFCRPKVTDGCPEAQAQRPRPSVTKDIAFVRPKVTNGCPEAQAQKPRPSVTKDIAFVRPKVTQKHKFEDQDLRVKGSASGTKVTADRSLTVNSAPRPPELPEGNEDLRMMQACLKNVNT